MTVYPPPEIGPTLIGDGLRGDGLLFRASCGGTGGPVPEPGQPALGGRQRLAQCALQAEPCAVKAARQFAHGVLGSAGMGQVIDEASIVISELVTNAIRYGLRPGVAATATEARIEVILLREAEHLLCVVTDSNPHPPVVLEQDQLAETGRGLCVIDALTSGWGWTPLGGGGKAVWAALPISPAAGQPAPPSGA